MRSRWFSALLLFAFLCSLSACKGEAHTLILSPFTATLSYTEADTAFEGVFTMKSAQSMQLLLRAPRDLLGLQFVFSGGETELRFGDVTLSVSDAETLGLPPLSVGALFEALSALCGAPVTVTDSLTAEVPTKRGTARVAFSDESLLPETAELGGVTFSFQNAETIS